MGDSQAIIRLADQPGDLGWIVMAHGELYAREFGWDTTFEALVARIVADYAEKHDPAREATWIAEAGGQRVGCISVVAVDDTTARLRVLLVDPAGRGSGLGHRLVDLVLDFAREAGYQRIVLWTHDVLTAAVRIYLKAGFVLTSSAPERHFGADLISQTYELNLR
ncbi:MAG TPA: GNAT family N-acetyltransferase [Streptosporangiaceae bacterium]|nr:GNAT family N-acetyltransferase [Streptosporangiaceae bacterium]